MARARIGICLVLLVACGGTSAPPPLAPERDLDPPVAHPDAAVAPIASPGSAAAVAPVVPGAAEAAQTLTALAAELRAAIASIALDPNAPDFDPRCHELDRKLDALRPRVVAAGATAHLAVSAAAALPVDAIGAALQTCRVRYQMELPGMEGLIDDLEDVQAAR